MPVPILFAGRPAVGAVGVDAATAPSHRGQGLFERMARAVYDDGGRHGMPVTLCFPNENSLRGFVKAGGLPVGQLRTFVMALDDGWLAQRFRVPRPAAAVLRRTMFRVPASGGAKKVEAPPAGLDELWSRLAPATPYGVRRDEAWWRWRYAERPGPPYRYFEVRDADRLQGAAAAVAREDFGGRFVFLLEFLAADRWAARSVLAAVAEQTAGDASGVATTALDDSGPARTARSP